MIRVLLVDDHQLLTAQDVIIAIPHLGGLDLSRILVLTGILVAVAVVARIAVRRRADATKD